MSIALDPAARKASAPPLRPWVWVGLAWGGAMLSKYHGVFLPMGTALFLLLHRPARRWLAHPGPYLAQCVALLVFSPVIIWNATHEWASFLFQGGRAVGGATLRPEGIAAGLAGPGDVSVPVDLGAAGRRARRRLPQLAARSASERFLLALSVAPLCVFTLVACFRPVLPHWGLIGLVSLFPLLGRKWSARLEARPRTTRRFLAGCAAFSMLFLAFTIAEYRYGMLQRGRDGAAA